MFRIHCGKVAAPSKMKTHTHTQNNTVDQTIEKYFALFFSGCAVYLLLIYSREKHGQCMSIGRSVMLYVYTSESAIEPIFFFTCLIICYYIVISISIFFSSALHFFFIFIRIAIVVGLTLSLLFDSRDELVRNKCVFVCRLEGDAAIAAIWIALNNLRYYTPTKK